MKTPIRVAQALFLAALLDALEQEEPMYSHGDDWVSLRRVRAAYARNLERSGP